MMEWQNVIVGLIILAACLYVGKRGLTKLRAMKSKDSACETGCGKCETSSKRKTNKTVFQISRLNVTRKR